MNETKYEDPVAIQFDKIIDYLNCYKTLNEEGRRKLMEYASDLVKDEKYTVK